MDSFRRKLLFNLLKLSDLCILIVTFFISIWFNAKQINHVSFEEFFYLRIRVINFIGFLGMNLIWHVLFNSFNLYRSRRLDNLLNEWKDIVKATTLGAGIFLLAGHIFDIHAFTPFFIGLFWLLSTAFTIVFRSLLRWSLKKIRLYGRNLRFIIIIGTNSKAYDFARKIEENKDVGYRILGFIDRKIYIPHNGLKLLGGIEDFSRIINENIVDEVVITLPFKSCYDEINSIVQKAEEQGLVIRYLSMPFDSRVAQSIEEKFEDFHVHTMSSGPQDSWQYIAKQILDRVFSIILIVATLPLMLFAAVAIKLTSEGPIFFIQDRIGYNKRIFRLYKFRTMVEGAEDIQDKLMDNNEMDGPVFKMQNDPRVTSLGLLLRKTSIDELPQLFNVLKGDMSLVGPRPLPVRDYSGFSKDWQRRRISVLPGITCTWQVNGRNTVSFEDWMKMDMEYIDNWKLSEDLKILFRTIPAVFKGRGAA